MKRVNCHRCIYYFVTWEQNQPHGCKYYGFKSKTLPSLAVFQSSGSPCSYFSPKYVECEKCAHYFETQEQEQPYGCNLFEFKSQMLPSQAVFENTGSQCQYFKAIE